MDIFIKILKMLGIYCVVALFAAGIMMLYAGVFPRTPTGWVAILIVSLPLWMFFEWLGQHAFSSRISRRIDVRDKAVSIRRMVYVFFVLLITGGTVALIFLITKDFWGPHFFEF